MTARFIQQFNKTMQNVQKDPTTISHHTHIHHILPITNHQSNRHPPAPLIMYDQFFPNDRNRGRLSDHLIVSHNVHHTSVECFLVGGFNPFSQIGSLPQEGVKITNI